METSVSPTSAKPTLSKADKDLALANKVIDKAIDKTVARARTIVGGALRAPETIVRKGPPPDGWESWTEYQAAKHALKPKKDMPGYLDMAKHVLETDAKLKAAAGGPRTAINVAVVTYQQGAPPETAMRVVDVKTEDGE